MAEGRRREQWVHTSHLLAELMNGPRTRRDKRPWTPERLNPYIPRAQATAEKVTPQKFVKSLISSML